jgi:hypothetical protein
MMDPNEQRKVEEEMYEIRNMFHEAIWKELMDNLRKGEKTYYLVVKMHK